MNYAELALDNLLSADWWTEEGFIVHRTNQDAIMVLCESEIYMINDDGDVCRIPTGAMERVIL